MGCLGNLALARDSFHDACGGVARDVDSKRAAGHILVGVFHVDNVGAGLGWTIGYQTGAILIVMTLDVGFAGTLY